MRELTIAGGTNEIQHNLIGERLLGLPNGYVFGAPSRRRVTNSHQDVSAGLGETGAP